MGSYEEFKLAILQLVKIDLNSYKERQMKRRIDALITKNGCTSYKQFVEELQRNSDLLEEFSSYITINVSEFYRNPEQWNILEKEIVPLLINRNGKPLKIWSAACSTGEEPYSLVMLLSRIMPLEQVKILATDFDKQVIEKAQLGIYNDKSLKGLPEEFKRKYFKQVDEHTVQITEQVKQRVEFRQHDLLLDPYPKDCDLIVCRNVLIYFTEDAKELIYQKFCLALKEKGILFVGSTEQMIQASKYGFETVKSFFYSKR